MTGPVAGRAARLVTIQRVLLMRTVARRSFVLSVTVLLSALSCRANAETVLITGANQGIGLEFARRNLASATSRTPARTSFHRAENLLQQ
jgi:hypothetical protein